MPGWTGRLWRDYLIWVGILDHSLFCNTPFIKTVSRRPASRRLPCHAMRETPTIPRLCCSGDWRDPSKKASSATMEDASGSQEKCSSTISSRQRAADPLSADGSYTSRPVSAPIPRHLCRNARTTTPLSYQEGASPYQPNCLSTSLTSLGPDLRAIRGLADSREPPDAGQVLELPPTSF